MSKPCIIVDIDGTIADDAWRLPMIAGPDPDFKSYFEASMSDPVHYHVLWLMEAMRGLGCDIFLSTGRPERYRSMTEAWLMRNRVPYRSILMRQERDSRKDQIAKREHLKIIRDEGYEPLFAVDDREHVVQMWRDEHIPCFAMPDIGKSMTSKNAFNEE